MLLQLTTLVSLIPSLLAQSSSSTFIESSSSSVHSSSSSTHSSSQVFPTLKAFSSNNGLVYNVNASVGNPQQINDLRVDIAQPYLWVLNKTSFPDCADTTTTDISSLSSSSSSAESTTTCVKLGSYNISESENATEYYDVWESLVFLDYIIANGTIVNDNFSFEGLTYENDHGSIKTGISLNNVDFINAADTNVYAGGLGLSGPIEGENTDYNIYFLEMLKNQGLINSSSYSWFPESNSTVDLVFGGVNQSHYVEPLVLFNNTPYLDTDTQKVYHNYPIVPLTAITVHNNAAGSSVLISSVGDYIPVLLDSRTTASVLPYSIIVNLAVQVDAVYSESAGVWYVKCSLDSLDATLDFQFGNLTIEVPLSEFIRPFSSSSGTAVTFDDGEAACYLGVGPNYSYGYSLLGTNFLKYAYLAVDNDGSQIAMAQASNSYYKSYHSSEPTQSVSTITSTSANSTFLITTTLSSTTTTSIPFESSAITSGYIPFATANNITTELTFSYVDDYFSSRVLPQELSGYYSSGTIYTGRIINATTTKNSSSSSSSAFGLKNAEYDKWNQIGLVGMLTLIVFGVAL